MSQVLTRLLSSDNGSSLRGEKCIESYSQSHPKVVILHTPTHASWLNQIEIYFSTVQRKVLTPGDSSSMASLADRILCFQAHYETIARPFKWTFTRRDLIRLVKKLHRVPLRPLPAAA